MGFRSGYRRTAAPLGVSKIRLELEDTKKFENMLHEKIQELEIELEDSNTDREKEVLVNQIDTLKCVLDHLFNLKPGSDEIRNIKMAETNNNYQKANRRKQLIKFQDTEDDQHRMEKLVWCADKLLYILRAHLF